MSNLGSSISLGADEEFVPDILLGLPLGDQYESPTSKIDGLIRDVSFAFRDVIDRDGKKISALVCALFDNSSMTITQTESRIRELLMDHHGTFSLFSKGLDTACEKASKGEKVSVELYVGDISHPDFLETLKNIKNQGIDPNFLILEIRAEDCGIIDSRVIGNLNILGELGFRFSLNGFIMVGDEIRANHLEKLTKVKRPPLYLRITKNIFDKICKGTSEIMRKFLVQIKHMRDKGVAILVGNSSTTSEVIEDTIKPYLSFLEKSKIKQEEILDIYGNCHAKECLFRPGDGMNVPHALEKLIAENMTEDLMCMQIEEIVSDIISGNRNSINVYIKDIGSRNFRKIIESLMMRIPPDRRSGLIFEILEVKYGSMNEQVLDNLRFLQKSGFSIAIDDLLLGDDTTSMSEEILFTLHEAGIYLDYIKIDGSIVMAILEGRLSKNKISEFKQILQQYSKLSEKTMFVLEWIQSTEHAIQLQQILTIGEKKIILMDANKILFQGRNINSENFGISHESDMNSNMEEECS